MNLNAWIIDLPDLAQLRSELFDRNGLAVSIYL